MKIDFEYETQYGTFRDAVILENDHAYTEQEIESMKQERLNNWLNIINNLSNTDPSIIDGEVISNG